MAKGEIAYSIVAPVYNERDNLETLYARLKPVLEQLAGESWEIVLTDDGSRDDSWSVIQSLHERDPRVVGLRFSRNFGHHLALTAGLDMARGQRVVTMDSDLQDQPEELPKLAAKMDEGFDVVYATRVDRHHAQQKQLMSKTFFWLLNTLSDVPYPITGAVFRMMSRRFVDELNQLRERHRLFTGLTAWLGFRQTSVDVTHGERHAGTTKYTVGKMLTLALDSITAFSAKPLYYVVYLGTAIAALSVLFAAYIVVRYFVVGYSMAGYGSLMTAITFIGGLILMVLGIIGQYIGRIFEQQKGRPLYIIESATREEMPQAPRLHTGIPVHTLSPVLENRDSQPAPANGVNGSNGTVNGTNGANGTNGVMRG